jgi:hypothetical protein
MFLKNRLISVALRDGRITVYTRRVNMTKDAGTNKKIRNQKLRICKYRFLKNILLL